MDGCIVQPVLLLRNDVMQSSLECKMYGAVPLVSDRPSPFGALNSFSA